MEYVLLAIDSAWTILLAGALAMVALSSRELKAARLVLTIAVVLFIIRWIMWGFSTDASWTIRAVVGAIVGALILAGLPALYKWAKEKEMPEEKTKSEHAEPEIKQPAQDPTFLKVAPGAKVEGFKLEGVRLQGVPNQFDIRGELKNADIKDYISVTGDIKNNSGYIEKMSFHIPPRKPQKVGHVLLRFYGGSRNADGTFTRRDEFEIDNGLILTFLSVGLKGNSLIDYKVLKDGVAVATEDSLSQGYRVKKIKNASGRYTLMTIVSRHDEIFNVGFEEPNL
jgi:hypothetical protein